MSAAAAVPAAATRRVSSVVRALDVLADPWSFLVLREAFFGVRRFDGFRGNLGIARNVLAARLDRLVAEGVLDRVPYQDRPVRHEYRLTQAGRDFYPAIVALMGWGDRWIPAPDGPPLELFARHGGEAVQPQVICAVCGRGIAPFDVTVIDGPGAGMEALPNPGGRQRPPSPELYNRGRPCSVARALAIIGDRWSFRILRDAFFRVRRFDELQASLGIARNVLAERLQGLVAAGVLERRPQDGRPDRHEYVLTPAGIDLYPTFLLLLVWGDTWRAPSAGPPLIVLHGEPAHRVIPRLVGAGSATSLTAGNTIYRTRYRFPSGAASPAQANT